MTVVKLMLIAGAAVFGVSVAHAADKTALDRELDDIVAGSAGAPALAGAALAVAVGEKIVYEGAAGCALFRDGEPQRCRRALKSSTKMRVASVSKMALSFALHEMAAEGLIDLDADASEYLGWPLRNPAFPDRVITVRQLLSHTSSIRDPEAYWVAAPGRFQSLFEGDTLPFADISAEADMWPGVYFTYANLNYGVLATVMERADGARFDEIMRARLFEPLGLDVGFNWSGVSKKARRRAAALYRMEEGRWAAQVDDAEALSSSDPAFLRPDDFDVERYLENYAPGENATLFSPQGGMRASVSDLLALLSVLRADGSLSETEWRYRQDPPNGETENEFYQEFGRGVQIVAGNESLAEGLTLIGHSGEAYGLNSGAWLIRADDHADVDEDIRIGFAMTGAAGEVPRSGHPTFNVAEAKLVDLALRAARANHNDEAAHHGEDEPRPFDASRNAMMDVDAALGSAAINGKRVLLVLGGNWCHDSRGLAAKFQRSAMLRILEENYELVWVDVGYRDRNLDIAERFGVDQLIGTPTVLILSPQGVLLNADTVHDWRRADSTPYDEVVQYFQSFALGAE